LLVEPSAQNLIKQSEAFNTAEYTLVRLNAFGSGSVVNTTATKDPFNGNNADYLQEDSTASNTHLINQFNAGQVSGTNLTFSIFVKAAERTRISLFNSGGGAGNASFDLTAGTATLVNGVSASIQNYGNGWYRCILTYTPNATGNFNVQVLLADASGNTTYNGTGNSGLYVFGAQVETGSVATSYIPTTTAAVTRSSEVIERTGASALIGQSEGTIYWDVLGITATPSTGNPAFGIRNVANSNWISLTSSSPNPFRITCRITTGILLIDYTANISFAKAAVAWSSAGVVLYVNGVQVATSATNPNFSFDVVRILGSSFTFKAKGIELYPNRLTNAQLQALTTP